MELPLTLGIKEIEHAAMDFEEVKKFLEGKSPKKITNAGLALSIET